MKVYQVVSEGRDKSMASALFFSRTDAQMLCNGPLLRIGSIMGVTSEVKEVKVGLIKWLQVLLMGAV